MPSLWHTQESEAIVGSEVSSDLGITSELVCLFEIVYLFCLVPERSKGVSKDFSHPDLHSLGPILHVIFSGQDIEWHLVVNNGHEMVGIALHSVLKVVV